VDLDLAGIGVMPHNTIWGPKIVAALTRRQDCDILPTVSRTSLKKGRANLYIAYAGTFTNNLYAHETCIRTQPSIEISFDLNPNLRKSKATNPYVDARQLAEGKITRLERVHIDDHHIAEQLRDAAFGLVSNVPEDWTLTIELEGRHSFRVRPKLGADSLVLSVVS
jgi:hypothetical protein